MLKLNHIAFIIGDITFLKKIGKESKLKNGNCSLCHRKKSMTVSDSTITAERLGDFFRNLRKKGYNVSKKWLKIF